MLYQHNKTFSEDKAFYSKINSCNSIGKGGATLLHRACKKAAVECVKILLNHGADVHSCDEWGVHPIHACAGCYGENPDSLKVLDLLLEAGDPNDVNLEDGDYKKTPLHYAAFNNNAMMCGRLLELGVDINAKDRVGRTPYQSSYNKVRSRKFLKEAGAEVPEEATPPQSPYPRQL